MARTGRPRSGPELVVTEAQRRELVRGARAATSTQAYVLRCRIVLACAEPGAANAHVAAAVGVTPMTVAKWRRRFIEHGLPGLVDEPRPGRPPSILLDRVEQVLALTLEQTPRDATHWSRSSMAERTGLSRSTIGRIGRRFELKPHLVDGFKLSTDPLFVEKVVDVVGLYHNPPERTVVLCVDEKSQMQALDRSSRARHPRFHVHFTPTGSSWLNQVERWFGYLTDQLTRRGVHKSVGALEKDVTTWIECWNENPRPFV